MSRNLNEVRILGQLGADPELRYTPSGNAVCNLRVATNQRIKGQNQTEWHRVVVWRKQAEDCAQYLKKGRQVLVTGSLHTRKWADKEGVDHYTTEITAKDVMFLGGPRGNNASESTPQSTQDADDVFGE